MQTVKTTAAVTPVDKAEPLNLLKRIGSTNYIVNIRFSETSKETLEDKILRLLEREVNKFA